MLPQVSRCAIICAIFSERGTILHRNGSGLLYISPRNQSLRGLSSKADEGTHALNPGLNAAGGLISRPHLSIALRMSNTAMMCARASQIARSANAWPGHTLRVDHGVKSKEYVNSGEDRKR